VIVSKRELLEHLYDYNWEHHSNVIEAHVSNLRKKLDGAMAEQGAEVSPVIETMRGRGYRMASEGQAAAIAASGPDPDQPL
jgi:two-component system response regulator PhoP